MKLDHFFFVSAIAFVFHGLASVNSAPYSRRLRDSDDDDKETSKLIKTEDRPKKEEEEQLFEGDIVLTERQKEANRRVPELDIYKRSVVVSATDRNVVHTWPNGTVPYKYADTLGARERENFTIAMRIISNATCIKFIHKNEDHVNYIELDYDRECKSYVGRVGGRQRVTLSSSCSSVGNALHELGHALGLWHEHSRPDRDIYIQVLLENLANEEDEIHFRIISRNIFKSVPDVGYDIQSIMHYQKFAYAGTRNGIDLATIRIKEDSGLEELECLNRLPMGQRFALSYKDKQRMRALYGCTNAEEEPPCVRPTPTATATMPEGTEIPETQMPSPSSTIPTPTPLKKRLKSGNILTLNLIEVSDADGTTVETDDARGVECVPSPGCTPIACFGSACQQGRNQFQIIKRDEEDTKGTIRGGNTVLLRSIEDYSHWLDCSDPTTCKISECSEDNADDPNNASYVSSCAKHRFKIYGIGRHDKVLNTNHSLQFKNIQQDGLLKCNLRKCGIDLTCRSPEDHSCITDIFRARKLAE